MPPPGETRAPVARALAVLEALNRAPAMTLGDIAAASRLPKSSAVRLLGQLVDAGYVERLSRMAGYRATSRVLRLASSFRPSGLVTEAAMSPMQAFTRAHRWPVFIGVPEGAEMIVRYGTVAESPLAVDALVHNAPTPFLLSALGLAYLAYCPAEERGRLLASLAQSRRHSNALAKEPKLVERALARVRRQGYAITDEATRRIMRDVPRRATEGRKRATGLGVPILSGAQPSGTRALGSLSLRYFRSSLSDSDAARLYLEPLRALARDIATAIEAKEREAW
jgi:IclR family mhp operon transcriptional activator